jgi:hypothetical protein
MSAAEYASQAASGHGTTLEVGNGASPEEFTAIVEVKTITPGAMTTADIDVSHLLSPQNHKERIPGQRDTAAIAITGNWRPTDPTQSNDDSPGGLIFLQRTRAVRNFRIVVPGFGSPSLAWPVRGYLSSFKVDQIENNSAMAVSFEIQPSQDIAADLP